MESLYIKRPIYPIISLISSLMIFCVGLFNAKKISLLYFLIGLSILYVLFGYGKALIKVIPVFFVLGIIVGLGAWFSSEEYIVGIQVTGRIVLLAYSSVIMVALQPVYLTRNLVQLKFPRALTLGMMATLKFTPALMIESRQIREAMKTRGVKISWTNLSMVYRAFLIPFIMRILTISDIMAVSVETRGFVLNEKSTVVYKPVKFYLRDFLFSLFLTMIMIGVFLI